MKKKVLFLVFLFSLILNLVFLFRFISSSPGRNGSGSLFSEDVHLSGEQKEQIGKESAYLIEENKKLEKKLAECRKDLYSVLESEPVDKSKVEKCIDDINNIQKKIQMNTIDHLLIYKRHLSKEQCDCFIAELGEKMDVEHKCGDNCKCGAGKDKNL